MMKDVYNSEERNIKNNITNVSMVHLSLSIQVNAFVYGFSGVLGFLHLLPSPAFSITDFTMAAVDVRMYNLS